MASQQRYNVHCTITLLSSRKHKTCHPLGGLSDPILWLVLFNHYPQTHGLPVPTVGVEQLLALHG
jgi:hypothetical protein